MRNMVLGVICLTLTFTANGAFASGPDVDELIKALKSRDVTAKQEAIDLLGAKGPDAAQAVPALTELLKAKSPLIRAHAAQSLGMIGEAAKPATEALVDLVGDKDRAVRREAIEALAAIQPGPDVTLPLLQDIFDDADPAVRMQALAAVVEHGKDAVPFLTAALKDPQLAYWACLGLEELGPDAAEAVPALIEALNTRRSDVKMEAILALGAIGEPAADATGKLGRLVGNEEFATAATYALGRIGKAPKRVIAKIEANKESADSVLQTVSLWTLARINPDNKALVAEAATVLVDKMKSEDPFARQMAAQALFDLDAGREIMEPIWEKALANADEEVIAGILTAMADLGVQIVPRLIEALEFDSTDARAAIILGEIGPDAKDAVPALIEVVQGDDAESRREAMFALGKIGPDAKPAVGALVVVLNEGSTEDKHAAAFALASIGPNATAASKDLVKALNSEDEALPLVAAWALTKVDVDTAKTNPKVVDLLISGLSEIKAEARQGTAEALQSLGSAAKKALPALKKALKDDEESVRKAAQAAIDAISK